MRILERFLDLEPTLRKGLYFLIFSIILSFGISKTKDPEANEKLRTMKIPYNMIARCPELKENPFRKRICKIFSSDGSGNLTLNEFFFLFSSLCERSPRDIKVHFAFNIYDFDGDGFIGVSDIEQVLPRYITISYL